MRVECPSAATAGSSAAMTRSKNDEPPAVTISEASGPASLRTRPALWPPVGVVRRLPRQSLSASPLQRSPHKRPRPRAAAGRGRPHRRCDSKRLFLRMRAGSTRLDLDKHIERPRQYRLAPCRVERFDRPHRIGEDIEFRSRPEGGESGQTTCAPMPTTSLARRSRVNPGSQHHRRLTDVGDCRAPSARLVERTGEVRRHWRFGVRSDSLRRQCGR